MTNKTLKRIADLVWLEDCSPIMQKKDYDTYFFFGTAPPNGR